MTFDVRPDVLAALRRYRWRLDDRGNAPQAVNDESNGSWVYAIHLVAYTLLRGADLVPSLRREQELGAYYIFFPSLDVRATRIQCVRLWTGDHFSVPHGTFNSIVPVEDRTDAANAWLALEWIPNAPAPVHDSMKVYIMIRYRAAAPDARHAATQQLLAKQRSEHFHEWPTVQDYIEKLTPEDGIPMAILSSAGSRPALVGKRKQTSSSSSGNDMRSDSGSDRRSTMKSVKVKKQKP